MKKNISKKVVVVLLLCSMTLGMLSSCFWRVKNKENGIDNTTDNTTDISTDNDEKNGKYIFGKGVETYIVVDSDGDEFGLVLLEKIHSLTGNVPTLKSDSAPVCDGEIVVGNTAHPLSLLAAQVAERELVKRYPADEDTGESELYDIGYFCVYSDGASVALIWSDEEARGYATEHFSEKYLMSEDLTLEKGYTEIITYSKLEKMMEREEEKRAEQYAEIVKNYDTETADAFMAHLAIYEQSFYMWLADLYDPGQYGESGEPLGGGFYYSNSARNNEGYRIDLESTYQVLDFLKRSGMLENYGNDLSAAIPEKMQKEMVAFALACQSSEDGYFYHPQWGSGVSSSRRSRDLDWATAILGWFGESPYWNTPNGVEGTYGAPGANAVKPASALTYPTRLRSTVKAVSSALSASSVWPEQLSSLENWKEYLEGFNERIKTDSYTVGHTVSSQSSQIKAREKAAIAAGELRDTDGDGVADDGYITAFRDYFNARQLASNGIWEEQISYKSVNGLLKIIGGYNGLGIPLPNAANALSSAVQMITHSGADVNGTLPTAVVDVYNALTSASAVIANVREYHKDPDSAEALRTVLKENAAEILRITTEKTLKFKKSDGSFGYTWDKVQHFSQGTAVAVPNTVEGDVNGGCIAVVGITNSLKSILKIDMPIFRGSDFEKFARYTAGLDAVIKDEIVLVNSTVTFDDDAVGSTKPSDVTVSAGTEIEIIRDPRDRAVGNVMRMKTSPGRGETITLRPGINQTAIKQCITLEWAMCIEEISADSSTALQIRIDPSYMFTIGLYKNGVMTVGDSSSTSNNTAIKNDFGIILDPYEWHTFKLEHYCGSADKVRTKIYIDGVLRAVSDNYLAKESSDPANEYTGGKFYALSDSGFTALFDNLYGDSLKKTYVEETVQNPDRIKDFEDGTLPLGSTSGGEVVTKARGDSLKNLALCLGSSSKLTMPAWSEGGDVSCLGTGFRFFAEEGSVGTLARILLVEDTLTTAIAEYNIVSDDGISAYIVSVSADGGTSEGVGTIPLGEWCEISLEYYRYFFDIESGKTNAHILVNGETVATDCLYYNVNNLSKSFKKLVIVPGSEVYLDDVFAESTKKKYTDGDGNEIADPDVKFPTGGEGTSNPTEEGFDGSYDFEDSEIGLPTTGGVTTLPNTKEYGNSITVKEYPDSGNKVLALETEPSSSRGNAVHFAAAESSDDTDKHVFEAKIYFEELNKDSSGQIFLRNAEGKDIFAITLSFFKSSKGFYFSIYSKPESGSRVTLVPSGTLYKDFVTLRIEYSTSSTTADIYINGVKSATTDVYATEAAKSDKMAYARIYTTYDADLTMLIDDVTVISGK